MGFALRKYIAFFVLLTVITAFCSSCGGAKLADIDRRFMGAVSGFGGRVVTFEPFSGGEPPREIISLYGRGGEVPDEFALIEYMQIWFSERPEGGDAAVFYALNATDAPSIVKMCERRARALKFSAGIESEIFVNGHFVVFVSCHGEYEGIGDELVEAFGK